MRQKSLNSDALAGSIMVRSFCHETETQIQLRVNNKSLLDNSTTATEKEQKSGSEEVSSTGRDSTPISSHPPGDQDSKQAKTGLRN